MDIQLRAGKSELKICTYSLKNVSGKCSRGRGFYQLWMMWGWLYEVTSKCTSISDMGRATIDSQRLKIQRLLSVGKNAEQWDNSYIMLVEEKMIQVI